ncbi:hypothetical protein WJX73_003649 [Symbiochloris irregularis]|uniref:Uncharacterized protein n=1 Tax=Symbiochloris irregularis TaxID=706552 RepID=A0AAW1PRY5_9CHLO
MTHPLEAFVPHNLMTHVAEYFLEAYFTDVLGDERTAWAKEQLQHGSSLVTKFLVCEGLLQYERPGQPYQRKVLVQLLDLVKERNLERDGTPFTRRDRAEGDWSDALAVLRSLEEHVVAHQQQRRLQAPAEAPSRPSVSLLQTALLATRRSSGDVVVTDSTSSKPSLRESEPKDLVPSQACVSTGGSARAAQHVHGWLTSARKRSVQHSRTASQ